MDAEVFLDAAYAVALCSTDDQYHQKALQLADGLEAAHARLVTTDAVILEIGNFLSKRYRAAAVQLIAALTSDPAIEIVCLSPPLLSKALQLYAQHDDKEWGLTDCVSFVVMQERGIQTALTADKHFRQAGFLTLLE